MVPIADTATRLPIIWAPTAGTGYRALGQDEIQDLCQRGHTRLNQIGDDLSPTDVRNVRALIDPARFSWDGYTPVAPLAFHRLEAHLAEVVGQEIAHSLTSALGYS